MRTTTIREVTVSREGKSTSSYTESQTTRRLLVHTGIRVRLPSATYLRRLSESVRYILWQNAQKAGAFFLTFITK